MSDVLHKELHFAGRLVMVGFGCVGQGVLPLLLRHIDMSPAQITLLRADADGADIVRSFGIEARLQALTEDNYRSTRAALRFEWLDAMRAGFASGRALQPRPPFDLQ